MKTLVVALLLWPTGLLAQSPFDGTWVARPDTVRLPQKPDVYSLRGGTYECMSCIPRIHVKADAKDYPVAGTPYFSSVAVQVIDKSSIRITEKQANVIVYSETDTLAPNGDSLVQKLADSGAPNGQPVVAEELYKRVGRGPSGSAPISGSWQAVKLNSISENGITVTYHSTPGGLQAYNAGGGGYKAKFDGKEYAVQGDPCHGTVTLKRVNANTIVETDKQDGVVHYKLRIVVSSDGTSMKVTETDVERGARTAYTMEKKLQT